MSKTDRVFFQIKDSGKISVRGISLKTGLGTDEINDILFELMQDDLVNEKHSATRSTTYTINS